MTRVFIVHRWDGHPREGWNQWTKTELEKRGIKAFVLKMPQPHRPSIPAWTNYFVKRVRYLDAKTFFIGHSIGCQTIMRAMKKFPESSRAGGAVFLAPWVTLKGLESVRDTLIAKPWEKLPIDAEAVWTKLPRIVAFFSDNDYYVPLMNRTVFEKRFGATTVVRRKAKHFSGEDGYETLPFALSAVLQLMKKRYHGIMKKKVSTVGDYISKAPTEAQKHLRGIRAILKEVAPKATEAIKWGSPVLEEKRILFAYTAHASHLNFMPTHRTLRHFTKELADVKTGKDTIQFPYDKPLPKALIRKIAVHRAWDVRENDSRWM